VRALALAPAVAGVPARARVQVGLPPMGLEPAPAQLPRERAEAGGQALALALARALVPVAPDSGRGEGDSAAGQQYRPVEREEDSGWERDGHPTVVHLGWNWLVHLGLTLSGAAAAAHGAPDGDRGRRAGAQRAGCGVLG
jgi:hypothetical protein